MYRAEKLPALPTNSHSAKSMDLLGKPIAVIKIQSPYLGMPNESFEVNIISISSISFNSHIYQIYLSTKEVIKYTGYSSIYQLGRFYSLTVNNKVTRLYTAVNFLHHSNIKFLRSLGIISNDYPIIQNVQN